MNRSNNVFEKGQFYLKCHNIYYNQQWLIDFLEKLTDLHNLNSKKTKKSLDMPIFNYCVMKYFSNKYVTGDVVHTPYRMKITQSSSWWKHK